MRHHLARCALAATLVATLLAFATPSPSVEAHTDSKKLTVVTYNIKSGYTSGTAPANAQARRNRMDSIGDVVAARNSEVVVLQEVSRGRTGWGGDDHDVMVRDRVEQVTGRTWHLVYFERCNFAIGGGTGGLSILSTKPISATSTAYLAADDQPRNGSCEDYRCTAGPDQTDTIAGIGTTHGIRIVNVHLSASCEEVAHPVEMASLLRQLPSNPTKTIVAGDFNTLESTIESSYLPGWTNHTRTVTDTDADPTAVGKIDHVYSTSDLAQVPGTECVGGTFASGADDGHSGDSDHFAVFSVVRLDSSRVNKPFRLFDTRCDRRVDVSESATRCHQVAGINGLPVSAKAVSANITVVNPAGTGWLTAHGQSQGTASTSTLNFTPNATVSNSTIVKVGSGGRVCVTSTHDADVIFDVTGYFGSTTQYTPTSLRRERSYNHPAWSLRCTTVAGGARPTPSNARAVAVNITVDDPAGAGYPVAKESGSVGVGTSTLNFAAGETIANGAVVNVSSSGQICIYSTVAARVIIDVVGHFPSSSSYRNVAPTRIHDYTSTQNTWKCGREVTGLAGVPTNAQTVFVNVTVADASGNGFLSAGGRRRANRQISTMNFRAGQTKAAGALIEVGYNDEMCTRSSQTVRVLIDVVGYSTRNHSV